MRLLPREEKFFSLLTDQAHIIIEASQTLFEAARGGNSQLVKAAEKIVILEQKGDEITHDVFRRLNQTFITPFDPEDIHSLASHLDDVLDGIEDTSHRLVAYQLHEVPQSVVRLCEVVNQCAHSIAKAIEALNTDRKILEHCIEINRLEGEADQIVRQAITDLFTLEPNPITILKQKEILELLEDTTDACEDVADVLESVVVKNS